MQNTQPEQKKAQQQQNYMVTVGSDGKKTFIFKNFESYPFVIDPEYSLTNIKGYGTFSIVCQGVNEVTNQPVAIKRIHRIFQELGDAKRILRQIKILKFLKHRNVVSIKDILRIDNPDTFNEVYLCLEYMEYTIKKLISSPQAITDEMIQFIIYQTLNAIYFMHSADIIHRDLKPENILINKKLQLKIIDMNLAKKEIAQDDKTYQVTTRPYRAPQVSINPNAYTKAIDIWSVGCIFAELLGKTMIFGGIDFVDQLRRFVAILGKPKLEIFPDLDPTTAQGLARVFKDIPDREKVDWKFLFPKASEKALDLLDHMLVYDQKVRYTAEQCLNHPYLQLYRNRQRQKCQEVFDFSFDKIQMTMPKLRSAIYQEVQQFQQKKTRAMGPIKQFETVEKKVKTE